MSVCNNIVQSLYGRKIKKIFHVGAHVGEEAKIYYDNHVEQVIWFEANEDLVPVLNNNIQRYNMKQMIVPYALFDENSELKFNITNNFQSSSLFSLDKHEEYYPQIVVSEIKNVQAFRLDSLIEVDPVYLPWHDFDFINIDTQGAELAILKGLGKHIEQTSLLGIYLEVNSEHLYKNIPLVSEIDAFLEKYRFKRIITKWTPEGWGDAFYIKTIED